jgi:hypothetical protein
MLTLSNVSKRWNFEVSRSVLVMQIYAQIYFCKEKFNKNLMRSSKSLFFIFINFRKSALNAVFLNPSKVVSITLGLNFSQILCYVDSSST